MNRAIVLVCALITGAHAAPMNIGPHTCEITWDEVALWIDCALAGEDLSAPESQDFWFRTGIEAYAGANPKPWKWFCDLEGRVKTTGDMVYPPDQVICTSDGERQIETGIKWGATPYRGVAGETIGYGVKVNTFSDARGRLPVHTMPLVLSNNPDTFAPLTLTESNRRNADPWTPSRPLLLEETLVLTWDPQDDAEWWWIYVTRDGEALPRAKAETNEYPLDLVIEPGAAEYKFEVTAEAESRPESERSDPYHAWIVLAGATCPEVPACPEASECPRTPAIQSITVECAP